jgi:transposase
MALNLLQAKQQMVHADGTPKLAKAISKEELVGYLELQEEKPNTINTTLKRVFNDIAEHFGILYKYDRSRGVYEQTDFQTVGGKKIQGSPKGRRNSVLDINDNEY